MSEPALRSKWPKRCANLGRATGVLQQPVPRNSRALAPLLKRARFPSLGRWLKAPVGRLADAAPTSSPWRWAVSMCGGQMALCHACTCMHNCWHLARDPVQRAASQRFAEAPEGQRPRHGISQHAMAEPSRPDCATQSASPAAPVPCGHAWAPVDNQGSMRWNMLDSSTGSPAGQHAWARRLHSSSWWEEQS